MEERHSQRSGCKIIDVRSHKKQQKNVLIGNFDKGFNEFISEFIKKDFSENYKIKIMAMSTPWSDELIDIIDNNRVDVLILFLNNIAFQSSDRQYHIKEILNLMKEIKKIYGFPIIALIGCSFTDEDSSLFHPNISEKAINSGADFFFPVPCELEPLKNAIGECLGEKL